MRRSIKAIACTAPVIDMKLGKRQAGEFEEARPADAFDPVVDALPVFGVVFISMQNILDDGGGFRPARWIVWNTGSDQLLEGRLTASVGMISAYPNCECGMFGIVNLHRRAGREAGTAANAFLFVDFK